jgi:ribosomal protein L21E
MEKIEDSQPQAVSAFAEGDTVKITGSSAYGTTVYIGYTGTIQTVSPDGKFASVRINKDGGDDHYLTYETVNLSKSKKDEIDKPEPKVSSSPTKLNTGDQPQRTEEFNLGDIVEVIAPSLASYGTKGKISDMDSSMLVIKESSTGEAFFAKKSSVKKIG